MARTGRPRKTEAEKIAAGTARRDRPGLGAEAVRPVRRRDPKSPPRRPLPRTQAGWRTLCSSLPGYDPWAHGAEYRFDSRRAAAAIDWIETHCRHVKGELAGQLLRLQDSQRAIVANLFGWVRRGKVPLRRYRQALIYVPRKNAKTTLAAAIALYVYFEDKEPGAEVYSAAAKRDQAGIVWRLARSMIVREPKLEARCRLYQHSIMLDDGESFFQPLASEGKSEHGRSTHFAIIDELHAQANADLMEALTTSVGGRRQPLIVMLTTADAIGESVCNEVYAYARAVRGNAGDQDRPGYDPTFLPVIYEASVEDDWTSEATWRRANPLYDASPTIRETLRQEVRKAIAQPSYASAFRRWYLNVRTETSTAWLRMDHWDKCGTVPNVEALKGKRCFAGLDLSTTDDLTALVLYFPDGHQVLPFFWVPEEAARERNRRNDPLYTRWGAEGWLTLVTGNVIDHGLVHAKVDELARLYRFEKIGIDRALAMQTALHLQARGYAVEFLGQGWVTMGEPCNKLEELLATGSLQHGGHPVLRWNASNVRVKVGEHGSKAPVKERASGKIDGIVSLLMALRLAMLTPARKGSVLEAREPLVLG